MEIKENSLKDGLESIEDRVDYWDKFYKNNHISEPSPFALFCLDYFKKESIICDLGCGNGRDSFFFSRKGYKVFAVDYSSKAIKLIESKKIKNIIPIYEDMSKLTLNNLDIVYSRFSLHSIPEEEENKVISWANNAINKKGLFCLEMRSDKIKKDEKFYIKDMHYRRFINKDQIRYKMESNGFKTKYILEGTGLAKFKNEDPEVIRIIAQK